MRLRRFSGADPGAALRRVKEVLGPEAVILATRPCPTGGVEITAAVDVEAATPGDEEARTVATGGTAGSAALGREDVAAILREIRTLEARVARVDRTLEPQRNRDPKLRGEGRALVERLTLHGLSGTLAARVGRSFQKARTGGMEEVPAFEESLARHLLPQSALAEARVTTFVGPTGSGKTTTIAKLAAARLAAGKTALGLVMADTYRIGAAEQLGAYARLLGVPMKIARDAGELGEALASFADRDAIFVDTAGFGGEPSGAAEVRRLLDGGGKDMAVTAVVSALTAEPALARLWTRLEPLAPRDCVVTKVDEGPGFGSACGWAAETGMRLRWLGTGQRVPQDLSAASGGALAHWLLAA
jgi:flagellar biosynthesis protein FlhF